MGASLAAFRSQFEPEALRAGREALLLAGPTGTGKSALAEALAAEVPCEIVSVDSCAVYRMLDIGSAKPPAATRARIPHHLIDIRDPDGAYSVGDFFRDVAGCVGEIFERGNLPVLAGGTMMYVNALLNGLDSYPSSSAADNDAAQEEVDREGCAAVHQRLARIDADFARRVSPNDRQRIVRALALHRVTGAAPSAARKKQRRQLPFALRRCLLMPRDVPALKLRVEQRFMAMLEQGLVDEVKGILAAYPPDLDSLRSVGYRQIVDHLCGRTSWDEAQRLGRQASSQLVKKQLTWLRKFRPRPAEVIEI